MPEPADQSGEISTDLIEYLLVVFPDRSALGSIVPALHDLVVSQRLRILDIVVVDRGEDGRLEVLELTDVDTLAPLAELEGDLGLLSERDIGLAAHSVLAGEAAIVIVAEDRWAERLSLAARSAGGRVVAGERIQAGRIEAALLDLPPPPDRGA